jgi:hypothetical protein
MRFDLKKAAVAVAMTASATAAGLALVGATGASAAVPPAAVRSAGVACAVTARNYVFPRVATTYRAGAAGSVTVAPVNRGTIRVVATHPAWGWRSTVDSAVGSSVDVYFHRAGHSVAFEAEINDWGGLTITVTSC